MSEAGYIYLAKSTFDHPIVGIKNPLRFTAWCWMLYEAGYKRHQISISGTPVWLERGQLSCSIRFMAKRCNMSIQQVRSFLECLKTNTMINIENNTGQNIITICNYSHYQDGNNYLTQEITGEQHSSNTNTNEVIKDNKKIIEIGEDLFGDSQQPAPVDKYAYEGKIIKLSPKDYSKWKSTYSAIQDFDAELFTLDNFYEKNLKNGERSTWWHRAPSALMKKHNECLLHISEKSEKSGHGTGKL